MFRFCCLVGFAALALTQSTNASQPAEFNATPQHYPIVVPSKPVLPVQAPVQAPQACGMQTAQLQYREGVPVLRLFGRGVERRQTRRASRGGLFRGVFRGC